LGGLAKRNVQENELTQPKKIRMFLNAAGIDAESGRSEDGREAAS
jgi:hypothetical protein